MYRRPDPRTPAQRAADTFDADLYRLMDLGGSNAHNLKSDPEQSRAWTMVAAELRRVRPRVREMMHAKDLADTE